MFSVGHLCGQASLLSVSFNIIITGGFFSSLRVIAKKKLYNVREIICHSNSDPSRLSAKQNRLNNFCILWHVTNEAKVLTCHSCQQRLPDIRVPLSRGRSLSFPGLEI